MHKIALFAAAALALGACTAHTAAPPPPAPAASGVSAGPGMDTGTSHYQTPGTGAAVTSGPLNNTGTSRPARSGSQAPSSIDTTPAQPTDSNAYPPSTTSSGSRAP